MNTLTLTKEANILAALAIKESVLVKIGNKIVGRFTPIEDELPDEAWIEAALEAEREGYLGVEASRQLIQRIRNA